MGLIDDCWKSIEQLKQTQSWDLPDGGEYRMWKGNENYYDKDDKLHRLEGPAQKTSTEQRWFYHGEYIPCKTQEEFERFLKLKGFW